MRVGRGQVLAYRAAVHDLDGGRGAGAGALGAGLRDNPPGRTARLALALRKGRPEAPDTVLVHSVRAAMHLHRVDDVGRYAAALRHEDGAELSKQSFGPFGVDLAADGIDLGEVMDEVAAAMRSVMADGVARTKGDLSGAVTPLVDRRLAPWCDGCGVHHVHDALFRYGTLQAGLAVEVESPTLFRFVRASTSVRRPHRDESRAEITRRFLRLAGPVQPAHLASWLGLTPAGARNWWDLVADDFVAVAVGQRAGWMHAADVDDLTEPPDPPALRLLPPYDPMTELGDRELLAPDPARRREIWRAVTNPGVLLVRGDIGGVWRQKRSRDRFHITVRPFDALTSEQRRALDTDAQTIARHAGAGEVETTVE